MIDIMVDYKQYIPVRPYKHPHPVILYWDGLSCERGHDAQVSRSNHDNSTDRLEGLHPSIQEWHHRAVCLQVIILFILGKETTNNVFH